MGRSSGRFTEVRHLFPVSLLTSYSCLRRSSSDVLIQYNHNIRKIFDEEIPKLASLKPTANVTRNYLDWYSPQNFNIKHARKVLD